MAQLKSYVYGAFIDSFTTEKNTSTLIVFCTLAFYNNGKHKTEYDGVAF